MFLLFKKGIFRFQPFVLGGSNVEAPTTKLQIFQHWKEKNFESPSFLFGEIAPNDQPTSPTPWKSKDNYLLNGFSVKTIVFSKGFTINKSWEMSFLMVDLTSKSRLGVYPVGGFLFPQPIYL